MTPTQLHAGYVLPPDLSKKPITPAEKITAMLRGCGIEILPNADGKQEVQALRSENENHRYYFGFAVGTDPQALEEKFNAAFPQYKDKFEAGIAIARGSGERRLSFALDFAI